MQIINDFLKNSQTLLHSASIKIIYCLIAIVIGLLLIRLIKWSIRKIMDKAKTDPSLRSFISSLGSFILYGGLLIVLGIIIGIKASAFVTLIGAIGIAVGLALQGSLANFAGGVLILVFKPFRIGDKVIINNVFGVVDNINILYTHVRTWNGKLYTFPNGQVANQQVENRSVLKERRVEIDLFFSFHEDIDQLRKIITEALSKHPDLLEGRPVQMWLQEFHDSYMRVSARCWTKSDGFWGVYWDQIEVIKKALEANNIEFSIPKREIHYPSSSKREKDTQLKKGE